MTQTRIDQFYKITSKNRKSENIKNNVQKSSTSRSSTINKKREKISRKLEAAPIYINNGANTSRISKKKHIPQKIPSETTISPTIRHSISPSKSPVLGRSSKFTPKTFSPIKEAEEKKLSRNIKMARRKLFNDNIEDNMSIVIDNLNLAKEGGIANNDINLEKVYSSGEFNYKYNRIDTTTSTRYEINEIKIPTDGYSRHFFSIVTNVFSKPINCGYFNEHELDIIFSVLTLSKNALALLIRMLKRKHTWHRVDHIKYDEISTDLKPIFNELVSKSILKSSMEEEDITVLLNLLQVHEIRKLCHEYKISASGKKEMYIQSILRFYKNRKPLFPGMPSPATKLHASVHQALGYCILINTEISEVIDRIIMLFMPNRDPQETIANIFRNLFRIESKEIKYPEVTVRDDFPIFSNKEHLLRYMEAKSALSNVLNAIEKKQWEIVRQIGLQAAERLSFLLEEERRSLENCTLPSHIRHFMPGYMWLKVLHKSVDAFKKTKETLPQAIQFLRMLIDQKCHMKHKKGQWYNEWIKIEGYHKKDHDSCVRLLEEAQSQKSLTEVDRLDLLEKAEKLVKRKSNISQCAKDTVKLLLEEKLSSARLTFKISSTTIKGTLCGNLLQRKSSWRIDEDADKTYTVEDLARYDYKKRGYIESVHCEGAFPLTLFGTLFWDEIYNIDVPGACVSYYEPTPMDLFTSEFYENRKEQIDKKLRILRKFNAETLSSYAKHQFELRCEYTSICQSNIFNSSSFQEVVLCLGVKGVVGICKRLIHNYTLWKAGFPDLIVWNPCTKQYKIVEVKGPGDTLSTKQKLWLEYLSQLELNTEVCYCESNAKNGRKRKHEAMM